LKNETKLTKHNYKSKKEEIGSFLHFPRKTIKLAKTHKTKILRKQKI